MTTNLLLIIGVFLMGFGWGVAVIIWEVNRKLQAIIMSLRMTIESMKATMKVIEDTDENMRLLVLALNKEAER